jgi:ABC-type cobalamin/Fe3+-siderophores transport system ATPase subunit
MRILSAKIVDFRGFEHLEITFEPQVTIVVGVNGSGKTSLLDAIKAPFDSIHICGDGGELLWTGTGPPPVNESRRGEGRYRIEVDVELPAGTTRMSANPEPRVIESWSHPWDQTWPVLASYGVDRHAMDEVSKNRDPGDWRQHAAWRRESGARVTFAEFFHWFREREDLENEDLRDDPSHRDRQLEAVRAAIQRLLPGYANPRVKRPRFDPGDRQRQPEFTLTKNGVELTFSQLSEGERTMAALAADVARRSAIADPAAEDPLAASGVVMIDEIELHLHPKWQAEIVGALTRTFPNLQFIVTTHSPIVVAHAPTESLRLLHDFKVVSAPAPTGGRDANSLLREVFDAPIRPTETTERLRVIAELIDADRVEEAREAIDELATKLGDRDPEVVRLRALLDFLMAE